MRCEMTYCQDKAYNRVEGRELCDVHADAERDRIAKMCGFYTESSERPGHGWNCADPKAAGQNRCYFHMTVEVAIEQAKRRRAVRAPLIPKGTMDWDGDGTREGDRDGE